MEIGIDALDLAKIYFLCSTTTVDRDRYLLDSNRDDIHVLHYDTFLSAIGHCALIAFPRLYELPDLSDQSAENDDLGPRILKSLFQHMAWCISKMPAVRRPAGGTLFVRALTVMFKSSNNDGNIDHLHMYRKRGDERNSGQSNIFLQHNGPSKVNTNTKAPAKASHHSAKSASRKQTSTFAHSLMGRSRVYDILRKRSVVNRSKVKVEDYSKNILNIRSREESSHREREEGESTVSIGFSPVDDANSINYQNESFSPKTATSIISPKLEFAAGEEQSISHSLQNQACKYFIWQRLRS